MSESKKSPAKKVVAKKKDRPKKETPKSSSSFSEAKAELQKKYADSVAADPQGNLSYKAQYLKALSDLKAKHRK
jgi:hypothetical protein